MVHEVSWFAVVIVTSYPLVLNGPCDPFIARHITFRCPQKFSPYANYSQENDSAHHKPSRKTYTDHQVQAISPRLVTLVKDLVRRISSILDTIRLWTWQILALRATGRKPTVTTSSKPSRAV